MTRDLGGLLAGGAAGAVVGALVLTSLPATPVIVLFAAVVYSYAVLHLVAPDAAVTPEASRRLSPAVGLFGGFFQEAVGTSGPVFGTWIHAYHLKRNAHVFALSTVFSLTGLAQLIVLGASGAMGDVLAAAAVATVAALAMVPLASRLRGSLTELSFDRIVTVVLVVSVSALLIGALI